MARILIVDDDARLRKLFRAALTSSRHETDEASDAQSAIAALEREQFEVILTDLRMRGARDGIEVLRKALTLQPRPAVILMSGHGTIEIAVEAIKMGAFDFIPKPVEIDHLRIKVERALEFRRLRHQVAYLNEHPPILDRFEHIIGANGALQRAIEIVRKVARSSASILIRGETGTGKELIASAAHYNSDRADQPFVKVNCAALHENLLESELFGHEKGAFTSADRQRIGRFEQADGGTIFLDEIGEMSPSTQAKVLRVLQEREFERLGSSKTLKVDVRVLTATHRNLESMMAEGRFRPDLFYRLNVVSVHVPPLRERKEDIPALTSFFLERLSGALKKSVDGLDADALAKLVAHDWPGNIRELENALERAVLLADGRILGVRDLSL
jgi:two-component system response regulator HydG